MRLRALPVRSELLFAALWACACHSEDPLALPERPPLVADAGGTLLPLPDRLDGFAVQSLALGIGYTCALLTGGTVKCWGSDEYGVLGRDTVREDISDPGSIGPIDFGDGRAVVRLAAGWHHVCALFEDAHARCWGKNESGQLGQGNTEGYGDDPGETLNALPDIPLERVIQIAAGVSNTCAIIQAGDGLEGSVHCWGSAVDDGLGDGRASDFGDDETLDALRPVALPEWANQIAVGDAVGCARLVSGAVQCWGSNRFGALGIGVAPCTLADATGCAGARAERANLPVAGFGNRFIASIQMNQAHACVLDNGGELLCWGRNDQSRAGYPDAVYGSLLAKTPGPVQLGSGVKVQSAGLGRRHGCALDTKGEVRCWGEAGPRLGYAMAQQDDVAGVGGTKEPREQYALMEHEGVVQLGSTAAGGAAGSSGNGAALRLFSGGDHNCVILKNGGVRCWGSNASGELGYGPFTRIGNVGDRASPAEQFQQMSKYDVCIAPSVTTPCEN